MPLDQAAECKCLARAWQSASRDSRQGQRSFPRIAHRASLVSRGFAIFLPSYGFAAAAAIAQLGEHQTEDLKVPGWIPGLGAAFNCRGGTGGTEIP